jgi:hypothetical protein
MSIADDEQEIPCNQSGNTPFEEIAQARRRRDRELITSGVRPQA